MYIMSAISINIELISLTLPHRIVNLHREREHDNDNDIIK